MRNEDSTEFDAEDSMDKQIGEVDKNKKSNEAEMSVTMREDGLHCVFKSVGIVITCVLVLYLMYLLKDYVHAVLLWAETQPPWAVIFILIALFTLVSLPLAWGYIVINLACGYLFGALYGLLVTVFTATTGILFAHLISRHLLSSYISNLLGRTEYLRALSSLISGPQACKVVILARLTPAPFGIQNAVFSASSLPTHRYLLASVLGLLPTQTCNAYIGSTLRSMEEVLSNSDAVRTGWMILLAQLFISIIVALFIVRKARTELEKMLPSQNCQIVTDSDLKSVKSEK
jgi:protein maelstrom